MLMTSIFPYQKKVSKSLFIEELTGDVIFLTNKINVF